jgi:hypothetical protein
LDKVEKEMSKWINLLTNAIIDICCHARKYGQAELVVKAYAQKNGVVRLKFIRNFQQVDEVLDGGSDDD